MVLLALKAFRDLLVLLALKAFRDLLVLLALKAFRVLLVLLVLKAFRDPLALPGLKAFKGLRVPLVSKSTMPTIKTLECSFHSPKLVIFLQSLIQLLIYPFESARILVNFTKMEVSRLSIIIRLVAGIHRMFFLE